MARVDEQARGENISLGRDYKGRRWPAAHLLEPHAEEGHHHMASSIPREQGPRKDSVVSKRVDIAREFSGVSLQVSGMKRRIASIGIGWFFRESSKYHSDSK
jgi:hypothetical protein